MVRQTPRQIPIMGASGEQLLASEADFDGLVEITINEVPHIGLVLSAGGQAIVALLTADEAAGMSQRLTFAAIGNGKKVVALERAKKEG